MTQQGSLGDFSQITGSNDPAIQRVILLAQAYAQNGSESTLTQLATALAGMPQPLQQQILSNLPGTAGQRVWAQIQQSQSPEPQQQSEVAGRNAAGQPMTQDTGSNVLDPLLHGVSGVLFKPPSDTTGQTAADQIGQQTQPNAAQGATDPSAPGGAIPPPGQLGMPGQGPLTGGGPTASYTDPSTGRMVNSPLTSADVVTQQYGPDNMETYLGRVLGHSPADLQAQYRSEQGALMTARGRMSPLARTTGEGVTYDQWLQQQYRNAQGADYWFLQVQAQRWMQTYGTAMPGGLMEQIKQQLDSLPFQERSSLISQFMPAPIPQTATGQPNTPYDASGKPVPTYAAADALGPGMTTATGTAAATGAATTVVVPWVDQAFRDWISANPTPTQEHTRDESNVRYLIESKINQIADQATVDRIAALPGAERTQAIEELSMPGTHLTVGQYYGAQSSLSSIWNKYFTSNPTPADVERFASYKDPQSMETAVRALPSHLDGINAGEYSTLHTAADSLRSKFFNLGSDNAWMQQMVTAAKG